MNAEACRASKKCLTQSNKATKARVLNLDAGAGSTLAFVALLLERSGRENSTFATVMDFLLFSITLN